LRVRRTLSAGDSVTRDGPGMHANLSAAFAGQVGPARQAPAGATAEGYWPDHDWLADRDTVFEFPLPAGTFFDCATVHLLTTATLHRLRSFTPYSRFEVPRFRPNFVIQAGDYSGGFLQNHWGGPPNP